MSAPSMFSEAGSVTIMGGNFIQNISRGQRGMLHRFLSAIVIHVARSTDAFNILSVAASPSAFFDAAYDLDVPRCHENTRIAVLNKIIDWVEGRIETEKFCLWLYGAAGAGKSAIARTISEVLSERGLLVAAFFFSRSDPSRNHSKYLIPTLAYSLALASPEARSIIESVIERDPHVFSRSLDSQLAKVILEPLQQLQHAGISYPHAIVIDGLDECLDIASQRAILSAISNTLVRYRLIIKVLIASRSELAISSCFNTGTLYTISIRHSLDDTPGSNDDIIYFLNAKFDEIKLTHPLRGLIPLDWPDAQTIEQLLWNSTQQFIYPSMIIKYISSPRHRPMDRLQSILALCSSNGDAPFASLDALYKHVVESQANRGVLLRVIGLLVLSGFWGIYETMRTPDWIESILGLEVGDVKLILADMSSLVEFVDHDQPLRVLHKSLLDFFSDPGRSKELYIDTAPLCTELALALCKRISNFGGSCIQFGDMENSHAQV